MKALLFVSVLICLGINGGVGYAQENQPDNGKLLELYQAQQYGKAASYLRSFYADTITDPAVLNRLGYCYRMAGDYGRAEPYYRQLYALDSLNVPTLLNLATVYGQRGRYSLAAEYYRRIIAVDSNHVAAYRALSGLTKREGDLPAAFNYLLRANTLRPEDSDIAYDFAALCTDLERYGLADTVLQRALETDPQHELLLLGKIKVAEKLKHYPEMVTLGAQLVEQGDESRQVLSLLARGYFHTQHFLECEETYNRLLDLYKQMGEIDHYYLAMAYKAMKRYNEGLASMDKVLELAISPNTAFYYGRKADLHDLANQPSAAVSSYLRSFQFDIIPLHYYSMAVVYDRKLSDPRNALRYFRQYIEQHPPGEEQIYKDYALRRINELQ